MDTSKLVANPERCGACVWLTGLSGAGKSSTAQALELALRRRSRRVVLLDGDLVRAEQSRDLGFSSVDRHTNVVRVATLARLDCDRGAIVICALMSPLRQSRDEARVIIGCDRFFEVLVDAPLEVCEARDPKGLYALARAGRLKFLTGIDHPYEKPLGPHLVIDTVCDSIERNVATILQLLGNSGFL